jgi:TonB family protein
MMASSNRPQVNEMLELSQRQSVGTSPKRVAAESRQTRNLLIAFVLLMMALVAVLFTDRQFWFGVDQSTIESDVTEAAAPAKTTAQSQMPAPKPATPSVKKQIVAQSSFTQPVSPVAKTTTDAQPAIAPVVTGTRVALPPLDVEVVAGDNHRRVHPGVNSANVEITRSGDHAPLTAASLRTPQTAYSATYPLLAEHMNVQGSVVLQALIGADGVVQSMHVLSGPSILAAAAQQAVREWKFQPVLQNGQAVETQATITVNFNIKVADNTPKIS